MAMPPHDQNNSKDKHSADAQHQVGGRDGDAHATQPYKDAKVFRDAEGVQWFVHEVAGDALGGGRPCLLLVSTHEVRRAERFPTNWRTLSPAALLELPHSRMRPAGS